MKIRNPSPAAAAAAPILLLLLVTLIGDVVVAQRNPIETCLPGDDDIILCEDIQRICEDLDLTFTVQIYDPATYCPEGKTAYIDPEYACNCAKICIGVIEKGEVCQVSYSSSYPSEMCGIGLDCMPTTTGAAYRCARNPSKPCVSLIIDYEMEFESGTLGPAKLQPMCDDVGQFSSKQCSTSTTCYCTDTEGNRLFGEGPYTEANIMDCKCSRHWHNNDRLGLSEGMRCLPNGNLDPLQCNEQFCFCYNSTQGEITQGPYHLSQIPQMSCYDPEYHAINYTNPCKIAEQEYLQQHSDGSGGLVLGIGQMPTCSRDGHYAAIQPKSSDFICVDYLGKQIEEFEFGNEKIPYTTCNCARRRSIMRAAGLVTYFPDCCTNGNYKGLQTRGLYAYCVDGNGNQKGAAVPLTDADSIEPCEEFC